MVLILRFLPILLLIFVAVLLARRFAAPKGKIVGSNMVLIPFLITLVGLFVVFVSATEFFTRM